MSNSYTEGKVAEQCFKERAEDNGWEYIRDATRSEDITSHWDQLYIEPDNGIVSVDIKAHKHVYRHGPLLKDRFWVEFRNVNGRPGWLYGEAKYIAFEYFGAWYIYDREILTGACELLVDMDAPIVDKPSRADYRIYQRTGRKDQTSLVMICDLPYKYHWTTLS